MPQGRPQGRESVGLRSYEMSGGGGGSYELTYFNAQGRAEVARYLFSLANTAYVDVRIEADQWSSELKAGTPFGQLPVLRVNGVQYCRSEAIFRFLAREFGFYGKSDEEGMKIDMVVRTVLDVFNETATAWQHPHGDHRERERVRIATESVPKLVGFLHAQLSEDAPRWLVGHSVSLADVVTYMLFTAPIATEFLGPWAAKEGGRRVAALVYRVSRLPAIEAHVSARQPTTF